MEFVGVLAYRHPDSGGHDKKVLASSLGSNYDEFGIRARLGIPVDVVNGETSSRITRRQEHKSQVPNAGYSPHNRGLEDASGQELQQNQAVVV